LELEVSSAEKQSEIWLYQNMYSLEDAPSGSEQPFVEIYVKTEFKAVGSVTSMILPENAIKSVGEGGALCCTEQLRAKGLCGDTDVIVKRAYEGPREITTLHYNGTDSDELKSTLLYNVTSSGPVYVIIVHCSDKSDTVKIEGYIQWFNPYGELPGNVYPVLPFTGTMALLYLLCLLPYLYLMRKYRGTLLKLQYAIGLVILLGIIEMGSMWIYYMVLNRDGHHVSGALVLALLFSNIKKAFSRVLVLLVAMGFGLVKWTLGTTKYQVASLGVLYFAFSLLYDVNEYKRNNEFIHYREGSTSFGDLFVVVITAVLDTAFLWWIFLSLIRILQQLTLRRQVVKLQLYKRVLAVLSVGAGLSVFVVITQLIFVSVVGGNDRYNWRTWWMWSAFWSVLYWAILVAISFLFRPRSNNTRYGHAEIYDTEDETASSSVALNAVSGAYGDVTQRVDSPKGSHYESEREKNIKETSQSRLLDKVASSFSLADDEDDPTLTEISKLD
jgi:hypothetical protein